MGEVLFSVWLAVQRNRVQGVLLRRRSGPHTSHTVGMGGDPPLGRTIGPAAAVGATHGDTSGDC